MRRGLQPDETAPAPRRVPREHGQRLGRPLRNHRPSRRSVTRCRQIVEDTNEKLGQPVVQNGLPLSRIHHAAFDEHLIGVDPDDRIHLPTKLGEKSDGPMLQLLKDCAGKKIHLPNRCKDDPDPARLEARFDRFRLNL